MSTTWQSMVDTVPDLGDLQEQARQAGRDGHGWWSTWQRLYEPLTKIVGPGSGGRFDSAKDFERAHRGLLLAWATAGNEQVNVPPWEIEGETEPLGPALLTSNSER